LPPFVCSRCGQNNQHWHAWATAGGVAHFSRFFFHSVPWGWLALFSFGLPILAARAVDFTPVASERIGFALAYILIFVNVALLYALKDSLWYYEVLAGVTSGFRPHLASLAVIAFVLALVFGLVIGFMLEARSGVSDSQPTEGLVRVITTILLAMTFVNVTLSAIFMAGHDYGNWLNRHMPQPIFAQEGRLLNVIEQGVREKIRQATGEDGARIEATIVEMERTNEGGAELTMRTRTDAENEGYRRLQDWKITADRWGRVRKMSREGPLQYVKLPSEDKKEAVEGKSKEDKDEKTPAEGELVPRWEQTHHRQSETTISVSSRNRQWME
jgi:hypothetical protein